MGGGKWQGQGGRDGQLVAEIAAKSNRKIGIDRILLVREFHNGTWLLLAGVTNPSNCSFKILLCLLPPDLIPRYIALSLSAPGPLVLCFLELLIALHIILDDPTLQLIHH